MADADALAALHETQHVPDPGHIAKLPKPTKKDNAKGRCQECGGWHGLPAVHLDYMGHAEVTDVLLASDPLWSWEPLALDEAGLPKATQRDGQAVLWIKLTVHGHTRLGVGTAPTSKEELHKELIGDAIRNAAMRFGVGLSLWSKAEGVERAEGVEDSAPLMTASQQTEIADLLASLGEDDAAEVKGWWNAEGFPSLRSGRLTEAQAAAVLDRLAHTPAPASPGEET